MSSFTFRQRTGTVDWRAVTSLKVDEVVLKGNSSPLQHVLDAVTFSEFRPDDVRNNSIESVHKLVSILQLIVEYLLHCQEAQFKAIRGLEGKVSVGKAQISKMKKEILSLKEDRKIYQRQLAMLRKSLGPDYFANNQSVQYLPPPKVTNLLGSAEVAQPKSNLDTEVIKSVFKHEEDTREFMATLLNDQRSAFVEQIGMVTQALQRTHELQEKENRSASEIQTLWAAQQAKVDATLRVAVEAMQSTVTQALNTLAAEQKKATEAAVTAAATAAQTAAAQAAAAAQQQQLQQHAQQPQQQMQPPKSTHEDEFTELALQTAALEQFEMELNRRQAALERKEREISDRAVAARQSLEMSVAARRASDTERLDLLTANEALTMKALTVGARTICSVVLNVLFRRKLHAFRQWDVLTQRARDTEQCNEQARLLVYAKGQRSVREKELEQQLQLECERTEQSGAKHTELGRALDAAQERVAELSSALAAQVAARQQLEANIRTGGGGGGDSGELYEQLQREKERAVVLTAKYNTLKARYDREVAAQEVSAPEGGVLKPSRDSSVMTSMEYLRRSQPSPGPSVGATSTSGSIGTGTDAMRVSLNLRQSVQQRYLLGGAFDAGAGAEAEDLLFRRAEWRAQHRKTQEEIEEEAMATLMAEIQARLTGTRVQ